MPATYLLLRNNKQSGPLQLDALLQQGLQPHDLIWVEGQSAGWRHPSEINELKAYATGKKHSETKEELRRNTDQTPSPSGPISQPVKNATHIYVSLPAAMRAQPQEESPAADALEAKAAALHQRIQAFAQGKATAEDTDVRPARSLDNMKQEYGAWLAKQEKKKKWGVTKRNLVITGLVLVVTTSVLAISKWIRTEPLLPKPSLTGYAANPVSNETAQTTTASFNAVADSVAATGETLPLNSDTAVNRPLSVPNNAKPIAALKKKKAEENPSLPAVADTTNIVTSVPIPEEKPLLKTVKTAVPLSRLVFVTGTLEHDKKGNASAATRVTLQNNSSETLKSVTVAITYFKKENRQLGKETVYFYNVEPGTAPVITISGNRKATDARFEIGAITRADGSLYLIH